jgi:predicted transcriptional regulator
MVSWVAGGNRSGVRRKVDAQGGQALVEYASKIVAAYVGNNTGTLQKSCRT